MTSAAIRDVSADLCDCGHWADEHHSTMFGTECRGVGFHPDDAKLACQCRGFSKER